MVKYLVNGEEFSTKKDATDAVFAAAADGDATLSVVEDDDAEVEEVVEADGGNLTQGVAVEL